VTSRDEKLRFTQKAREAKEDLGKEGTVRWEFADRNVLGSIYGCTKSAK